MKITALYLSLFAALAATPAHADNIGFRQITVADTASDRRPLQASIWYPSDESGSPEITAENAAFKGQTVYRDVVPRGGEHPLVLLSHGHGGNWRNQSWLATELVKHGYIVAATDHPGTSTSNHDPAEARRLWERPRDLSRIIDALTVTAIAGARFDHKLFRDDCLAYPTMRACMVATDEFGLGSAAPTKLSEDMRDPRIGAIVALDPGLTEPSRRTASPASLYRLW